MLPNLIIIGAGKCGTTSLHYYLGLHPQICMSRIKELNFFVRERNWERGLQWYESHFTGEAIIYGEASPLYTAYPRFQGVPERMHSVVPKAQLIYLVRDPIERIISHYTHFHADGLDPRPMKDALKNFDSSDYICRSKYYMQLEQYLEYYPQSSILVIDREDLLHNRLATLQRVFRFLGVDDAFSSPKFSIVLNETRRKRPKNAVGLLLVQLNKLHIVHRVFSPAVRDCVGKYIYLPFSAGGGRPTLDESLRQELIEYLRDDANRLREFTGYSFEGWCV